MSVYSGFATRQQESNYNSLLQNLVLAMKKRLIKFYNQESCDEGKFKLLIKKIYKKMYVLEKGKFMPPKISTCLTDLIETLNIDINYQNLSNASSMLSETFSLKKDQTDSHQDVFKSKAVLQSKKNVLKFHRPDYGGQLESSRFSLRKKLSTLGVENQEDHNYEKRGASMGLEGILSPTRSRGKIKLRQLKDLRELRGAMHMPRVSDFLPKKNQIEGSFFLRDQTPNKQKEAKVFRRQKYSRTDISVEQI